MNKELESRIAALLKSEGFKKKSRTWWIEGDECVSVLNLQKSSWGETYYINCGVVVKHLGGNVRPAISSCHLEGRMEYLMDNPSSLQPNLEFGGDPTMDENKIDTVVRLLQTVAIPVLRSWQTVAGVKKWALAQKELNWLITPEMRGLLGIPE
jgi:hypothetical protein